VNKVRRC